MSVSDLATAAFALACALLVYAGAVKAVERGPLVTLRSRALGMGEAAVGAVALVTGGPVAAAAVGLLYGAFAVYVVLAIRRGQESCNCFGAEEKTPPSRRHVAIDGALSVGSLAAAAASTPAPIDVAWDTPFNGVVYALFLLTATGMTAAALTT